MKGHIPTSGGGKAFLFVIHLAPSGDRHDHAGSTASSTSPFLSSRFSDQPEASTTSSPPRDRPAATFMRLADGSRAAATPRLAQKRPSALAQYPTSPSIRPWLGRLKTAATIVPSRRTVRLGQAQTLSTATYRPRSLT